MVYGKKLNPDLIIESGIYKGQGTWFLEQACPNAKIISIDLNLEIREYISKKVTYLDKDFSEHLWDNITDKSLVFFDDHQNAYQRLQQCKWFGFKNIIFEDNYPVKQGDYYSLQKIFANTGFISDMPVKKKNLFSNILQNFFLVKQDLNQQKIIINPNNIDSFYLRKNLEIYYTFPPVIQSKQTRWGDNWEQKNYPTPTPLLEKANNLEQEVFIKEANSYTWISYVKLK